MLLKMKWFDIYHSSISNSESVFAHGSHLSTPVYYCINVVLMKMAVNVNSLAAQHNTGQIREAPHDEVILCFYIRSILLVCLIMMRFEHVSGLCHT